jgi:hypothetical protein
MERKSTKEKLRSKYFLVRFFEGLFKPYGGIHLKLRERRKN